MERRHVEYTCRQESESTSFPIFDREELESCNTKFPRNTKPRCSRSSRELSFVVWLPNFPITAWWDGDVRFFGCNRENESSLRHCRMIFHKRLYWKAMEAPEKLSSDEQRWKTTGYGVSFSSSSTLFRDNRTLIYSALLVLILTCLYLHLLISCWECDIFRKKYSITKLSLSIGIFEPLSNKAIYTDKYLKFVHELSEMRVFVAAKYPFSCLFKNNLVSQSKNFLPAFLLMVCFSEN